MNDRVKIAFAALAVAMQAKTGCVDQLDVDDLLTKCSQLLQVDDPLRIAVTRFTTQLELRPTREELAKLGHTLTDAIELALRPDPPDAHRADIYG